MFKLNSDINILYFIFYDVFLFIYILIKKFFIYKKKMKEKNTLVKFGSVEFGLKQAVNPIFCQKSLWIHKA